MISDPVTGMNFTDVKVSYLVTLVTLTFFRPAGFLLLSPILVKPGFSSLIRTGFFISIGFIVGPSVHAELRGNSPEQAILMQAIIKELVLGFLLAFLAWLVVHAIQFAGVIIDTQRGATTAQDFNPLITTSTTNLSNLLVQAFVAYFFSVGGFLAILKMLFTSYKIWPVLDPLPNINLDIQAYMLEQTTDILHYGLLLAAPIVIATLAVDLYVAFLSKKAQQLQPLTFSGPIKTIIAFLILIYSIQVIVSQSLERMVTSIGDVIHVLQEGI